MIKLIDDVVETQMGGRTHNTQTQQQPESCQFQLDYTWFLLFDYFQTRCKHFVSVNVFKLA